MTSLHVVPFKNTESLETSTSLPSRALSARFARAFFGFLPDHHARMASTYVAPGRCLMPLTGLPRHCPARTTRLRAGAVAHTAASLVSLRTSRKAASEW